MCQTRVFWGKKGSKFHGCGPSHCHKEGIMESRVLSDHVSVTALATSISKMTMTKVFLPGSRGYEARRKVTNGLCSDVKPALIAVPETTKHVSDIAQSAYGFMFGKGRHSIAYSYKVSRWLLGKNFKSKLMPIEFRSFFINKVFDTAQPKAF